MKLSRGTYTYTNKNQKNYQRYLLFINPFENAFFCFEDFTFRAAPGVRDIFPRGSRSYSIFGIAFQRIIDVMAFETYASYHTCRLRHGLFNSKDIAGYILLLFCQISHEFI